MIRPALIPALLLTACAGPVGAPLAGPSAPTGVVLVSLSGLRFDVLEAIDGEEPLMPFLAALADRGRSYQAAFSASPNTLVSHLSLVTGLMPPEHDVRALTDVLSPDVPVVSERFAGAGFRTAGFTDGGYLTTSFAADRGFDEFVASRDGSELGPLERGVEFLNRVGSDPFFLFIQSQALDPPFGPPDGEVDIGLAAGRLNSGFLELTPALRETARSRYEAAARQLDRELERFVTALAELELEERTVVVVTADHGAELGEHGRLAHTQVYPESIRVPLLVVGPGIEASSSPEVVRTAEVTPTLARLAGLPPIDGSGLPGLAGSSGDGWAYALMPERHAQATLLLAADNGLWQLVVSRPRGEHDGTWITRAVTFDTTEPRLAFSIVSFHIARSVVVTVDGETRSPLEVGTRWADAVIELGTETRRRRVTFATAGCTAPSEVGVPGDPRCLSFKMHGLELERRELFELKADPLAAHDLSNSEPTRTERMYSLLVEHPWQAGSRPAETSPSPHDLAALAARAALPEPPFGRW